eukprot:552483-Pyramimonas_sp.AAC.1
MRIVRGALRSPRRDALRVGGSASVSRGLTAPSASNCARNGAASAASHACAVNARATATTPQ